MQPKLRKLFIRSPRLLTYVPVLFEDIIDRTDFFNKAEQDLGSVLAILSREVSIKSDSEIMADYSSFYQPIKDSKPASSTKQMKKSFPIRKFLRSLRSLKAFLFFILRFLFLLDYFCRMQLAPLIHLD